MIKYSLQDMKPVSILLSLHQSAAWQEIKSALQAQGFDVADAPREISALADLLETREFEAALLDLQSDFSFGWQAFCRLREKAPQTECIVTVNFDLLDAEQAQKIQSGSFLFLSNPFSAREAVLLAKRAAEKKNPAEQIQQSVEQKLRETAERYNRLVERSPDILYTYSTVRGGIYYSPQVKDILGYTPEYLYQHPHLWNQSIHPEDRARISEVIKNFQLGDFFEVEYRIQDAHGNWLWLRDWSIGRLVSENEILVEGAAADITRYKQAEQKLRESEERFRSLIDSLDDVIYTLDTNQRHSGVFGKWVERSGLQPEFFLGKTARDLFGAEAALVHEQANQRALSGESVAYEWSAPSPNGMLYYQTVVSPLRDSKGNITGVVGVGRDITVRKRAEEQNRMLTAALEAAANGIVITNVSGEIEWVNPAWFALTGYSKEESIGQNPRILKSGLHPLAFYQQMWSVILDGKVWRGELVNKRKDGTLYEEEETITPVFDEAGNIIRFIAIKQDITERKQVEKSLFRTNLRLQSLRMIDHALLSASSGDQTADMEALRHLAVLVPCGNISMIAFNEINDSAKIIARASGEIPSVVRVNEPVHPSDLRLGEFAPDQIISATLSADAGNSFERNLYESGGRSLVKAPLIVQGRLIGVLALVAARSDFFTAEYFEIIRDVSAQLALSLHHQNLISEIRRYAEKLEARVRERTAEIEATRQRLELAVNAGKIGVWELNFQTNAVIWNEYMYFIYGIHPQDFSHSFDAWQNLIHESDRKRFQEQYQAAYRGADFFEQEYRIVRPDGTQRLISFSALTVRNEMQAPILMLGVNLDVTETRAAQESMRRANLEMERALRVKSEFLANMSHELRTPLNAIIGISESLLEQLPGVLNEKQQKYVATINESGAHLLSLINDILDLSKIEAGRMDLSISDVPVQSLFDSSFRMVKEIAQKKNIQLDFQIDPAVQFVRGDARRLLQMMVNLLSNAVKFTPSGGRAGAQAILRPEMNEIDLVVWDTGIGISQEDMPRLFQPFVQLDSSLSRSSSGTGLGLMLVMQMARMHGGNVSVESKVNEGSRFTITLPYAPMEQPDRDGQPNHLLEQKQPVSDSRKGHILLVEDTESVVLFVADYLQAHGHRVSVARDGFESLEAIKKDRPDLALLDIQMPGMDGFEVIKQLRAIPSFEKLPVIALTALAMPGDRERCLSAGMTDYISKPVRLAELANLIQKYLI